MIELNRNRENYHADVEQSSFSPAGVVPGIGHSPGKMLQFRVFAYADAARYRLGANHAHLPVNQPRCPVNNYARDGVMRCGDNGGGNVNYEPNSFGGPVHDKSVQEPPLKISGDADCYDHRVGNDDYSQPGNLFRLMSDAKKQPLFSNIAAAMQDVPEAIIEHQLGHFAKADPAYAEGVKKAIATLVQPANEGRTVEEVG